MKKTALNCPCGSGNDLANCCGKYLEGTSIPQTPEALMRSRYTAYVLENADYLLGTWHASHRPAEPLFDQPNTIKWIGLTIHRHGLEEDSGVVEFTARYKVNGRAEKLHEVSQFKREGDRWFYTTGEVKENP